MNTLPLTTLTLCAVLSVLATGRAPAQEADDSTNLPETQSGAAAGGELTELEREIQKVQEFIHSAPEDSPPPSGLQKKLRDLLGQYFERELELRERELGKLEEQVQQLRGQLEQRRRGKEQILDQQMRVLLKNEREKAPKTLPQAGLPQAAVPPNVPERERSESIMRAVRNLKYLTITMHAYMEQHNGSLPPSLSGLPEQRIGNTFHDPQAWLSELTEKSSLLYMKVTPEILSELEDTELRLGAKVWSSMPVLLVQVEGRTLTALADGSIQQMTRPLDRVLNEQFRFLKDHVKRLRISVKAGSAVPVRDVVEVQEMVDEIGIQSNGVSTGGEGKVLQIQFEADSGVGGTRTAADREQENAWYPLKVRIVNLAGEPLKGRASISGQTFAGGEVNLWEEGGEDGWVDFGQVPAGQYRLNPRLLDPAESTREWITVGPSRPGEYRIVGPTAPAAQVPIEFDIRPPEDLAELELYYLAKLDFTQRKFADRIWRTGGGQHDVTLLVGPDLKILGTVDEDAVTTTSERHGGVKTTDYSDVIQPELVETDINTLPAYNGQLTFVAYAPRSSATGDEAIPELWQMSSRHWLLMRFEASEGEGILIQVKSAGDEFKPFWDAVRERTSRLETRGNHLDAPAKSIN